MVAHAASEARRHGMGLDLPQGSGWRIGGPSVPPADVNAALSIWVDSVPGNFNWSRILDDRHVDAILAIADDGRRIHVPIDTAGNYARWHTPPARRWWIYFAGTRFSGDAVKRPTPGGEGKAIDPFSAGATDRYLAMFAQRTAGWSRGAIRSYFHDSFEYTGDGSRELLAGTISPTSSPHCSAEAMRITSRACSRIIDRRSARCCASTSSTGSPAGRTSAAR
jgi:hypothetical protein